MNKVKTSPKNGFAEAKNRSSDADEKANRRQNRQADTEAANAIRNDLQKSEANLLGLKVQIEEERRNGLKWLPRGVYLIAFLVLSVYFFLLYMSGTEGNGFKLEPVVLSSVGATAVVGSLGLIGYVLKGLYQISKKPRKKKSR